METRRLNRRGFLRLSAGLVCSATAATLLAACQPGGPSGGGKTESTTAPVKAPAEKMRIVCWDVGKGWGDPVQRALVAEFNETHPDIEVQLDPGFAGIEWQAGLQKLRVALDNQSGPDFTGGIPVGASLEAAVASNQVLDLGEAYRQYGWDKKIAASLVDTCRIQGHVYAVPANVETVGVFYNIDLYNKVGIGVPKTFDDFLAGLETLKKAGYYGYAIGLAGGWPSAFMASEFMYLSAGKEYADVLSGKRKWTGSERCLNGMKVYHSLVANGYTNPEVLGINQNQANDLFFQGKTAGTLQTSAWLRNVWDAKPDFKVGFYFLPKIDPASDIMCLGGVAGCTIVARYTKHKEAAFRFIDYLLTEKVALKVLKEGTSIEPIEFSIPDDIDPLLKQVATETVNNVGSVGPYPVTYLAPQVFNQLNAYIQGMMGGKLTPEQVMQEMQKAYEKYLQEKSG